MKTLTLLVLTAATAALMWPITLAAERGSKTEPVKVTDILNQADLSLDKTGTSRVPEDEVGPQVPISLALASSGSFSAERTGFEPADQC